jgi:30S ribosomal protein 3|tara:strand:+ start:421 stop:735 length:315 start_codon:yes stop_codon:yes gene_type:complete
MSSIPFRLKLKVIWFKSFLGLAIDQITINQNYSITPYYFWPRTEAWDQLKLELDSKTWLSQDEKVKTLTLASDIMNYWLEYRNTETSVDLEKQFQDIEIVKLTN